MELHQNRYRASRWKPCLNTHLSMSTHWRACPTEGQMHLERPLLTKSLELTGKVLSKRINSIPGRKKPQIFHVFTMRFPFWTQWPQFPTAAEQGKTLQWLDNFIKFTKQMGQEREKWWSLHQAYDKALNWPFKQRFTVLRLHYAHNHSRSLQC